MQILTKKIVVLGFGAVGQCFVSLLLKHVEMKGEQLLVIDALDKRDEMVDLIHRGVQFVRLGVNDENLIDTLKRFVGVGDYLIDAAYNVNSLTMATWCYERGAFYLGTCLVTGDANESSQYEDQVKLKELIEKIGHKGPTAVFQHGINPGIVSHMMKEGILDLAIHMKDKSLEKEIRDENFPLLAQKMGIKTIHVSDIDTQEMKEPKKKHEFVSSFSPKAFFEESNGFAELSLGTHEVMLPDMHLFSDAPYSQVYIKKKGKHLKVKSWTPSGPFTGFLIRHEEPFTMAEALAIYKEGKAVYRPSVYFSYAPSKDALDSLLECKEEDTVIPHAEIKIMHAEEIARGSEECGVLLMGHKFKSWWTGSCLSIEAARVLLPETNVTVLQTAIPMVAALLWMMRNPDKGFNNPEDLPWREIVSVAKPYLGTYHSIPVDWAPHPNTDWRLASFLQS